MDLTQTVITLVGVLAGPAASLKVASIQAGRTLADITTRLGAVEKRLGDVEQSEPENVAELRGAIEAIAKDVYIVRGAVERLRTDVDKMAAEEEKRRERAAARAERREEREREADLTLAARLAELQTMVRTLTEELRDVRRAR